MRTEFWDGEEQSGWVPFCLTLIEHRRFTRRLWTWYKAHFALLDGEEELDMDADFFLPYLGAILNAMIKLRKAHIDSLSRGGRSSNGPSVGDLTSKIYHYTKKWPGLLDIIKRKAKEKYGYFCWRDTPLTVKRREGTVTPDLAGIDGLNNGETEFAQMAEEIARRGNGEYIDSDVESEDE